MLQGARSSGARPAPTLAAPPSLLRLLALLVLLLQRAPPTSSEGGGGADGPGAPPWPAVSIIGAERTTSGRVVAGAVPAARFNARPAIRGDEHPRAGAAPAPAPEIPVETVWTNASPALSSAAVEQCYPSSADCPSAVRDLLKGGDLLTALKARPPPPDANSSALIVTVLHSYQADLLEPMLEQAAVHFPARLKQWVFIALDSKGHEACTERAQKYAGITCVLDPAHGKAPIDKDHLTGPQVKFLQFRWRVAELVAALVQEGFDVVYTAAGKVWLEDAIPTLQLFPAADLQVVPMQHTAVCSYNSPLAIISSDFYLLRATDAGKQFAKKWIEKGALAVHKDREARFHDIKGMNAAARDFEPHFDPSPDAMRLKVHMLNPRQFPGDERLFKDFSTTCDALVYPTRHSWSVPLSLILEHANEFRAQRASRCGGGEAAAAPAKKWHADGCSSPYVTTAQDTPRNVTLEANAAGAGSPVKKQPWGAEANPAIIKHWEANIDLDVTERAADAPSGQPRLLDEQPPYEGGNCEPGCYARGTCFEELGRCDCPSGWRGATCEKPAVFKRFMRSMQRLELVQQAEQLRHPSQNDTTLCNLDCGAPHRGACLMRGPRKTTPTCICVSGWGGANCADRAKTYCLGGCGGRGRCHRGFCLCQPGYYGSDCGLTLGPDGKSMRVPYAYHTNATDAKADVAGDLDLPPEASRDVKVYVYELPPAFNVWLYSEGSPISSAAYKNGMFGSSIHPSFQPGGFYVGPNELLLHERMLGSARRTLDPDEADFFYVPAWGQAAKVSGGGITDPALGSGMHAYWATVKRYVQTTWPFWDRRNGTDHIWTLMGDHGLCESPRGQGIPPALETSIILSNWGLWTDSAEAGYRPYMDKGPCFRRGQDIVIPAPFNSAHSSSPFRAGAASRATWRARPEDLEDEEREKLQRNQLIYFKGQLAWGGSGTVMLDDGVIMYSHGVRLAMNNTFGDPSKYPDVYINRVGGDATRAKFCLAPAGLGFGVRVPHAMADGCIPLIIQDNVSQPFEDEFLPYSLFSVRLAEADIPRAHEILSQYTPDQIEAMQKELECAFPYFLWSSVYGAWGDEDGYHDAFEALMGTLQRRKRGAPYEPTSLCPKEGEPPVKKKVCHMFCDALPHGPPNRPCQNANVPTSQVCQVHELQPSWQPWPAGCALQT